MIRFDGAPAVPLTYPHLSALTAEEIKYAIDFGYVSPEEQPGAAVNRKGRNYPGVDVAKNDLRDWRSRMCIIWFCYIYENFDVIRRPLMAIEELVLEFGGIPMVDDSLDYLYAGAGGSDAGGSDIVSEVELERHIKFLKPRYERATRLMAIISHT